MFKTKAPLFFTLFWTAITGTFLIVLGHGAVNQMRSFMFASTVGTVDSIRETVHRGSKGGTSYGIDIAYHFTVNQRRYDSTRLRYLQGSSSKRWAAGMLEQWPVGAHPTVYYNPGDPAQAVLIRGLEGHDLFMALFLTPFTLIMLMLWVGTVQGWRKTKGFMGLRILEQDSITRIRPSGWIAVGVGAVVLGIGAFLSIFVLALGFGGDPSLPVAGCAWIGLLALALAAGLIKFARIRAGREDVVLDDGSATLLEPKGVQVPYTGISGVHVVTKTQRSSKGQTTTTYEVWLHYQLANSAPGRLKLEEWSANETDARRFAAWLGLRIGAPVADGNTAVVPIV